MRRKSRRSINCAGPGQHFLPGSKTCPRFGLINALTVAALAETVARSGITRFSLGYLGQLVSDLLGGAGSLFLTFVSAINNVLVLVIFYLGIAGTLEGATGLSSSVDSSSDTRRQLGGPAGSRAIAMGK